MVGQVGPRGENVVVEDNKKGIDHVPIHHLTMVVLTAREIVMIQRRAVSITKNI